MQVKKLSLENKYNIAVNDFKNVGFVLDTNKECFSNIMSFDYKLDCYCEKHQYIKRSLNWKTVRAGRVGCSECTKDRGKLDYTKNEKIEILKSHDIEYVSGDIDKIVNNISVKCQCGRIFSRSFSNIIRSKNYKCNFCNNKIDINYWNVKTCQDWIDENKINYTVFNTQIDEKSKIFKVKLQCARQHNPYWVSWTHFHNTGTRCKQCYYEDNNKKNWTLDDAKEYIKQFGFTMIDESKYKSSHKRFPACDNYGFIYMISIHYLVMNRTKFQLWKNNPYALHNIKLFCKLYRPDYEFLSDNYYGNKEVHKFKYIGDCLEDSCNRVFEIKFGYFVNSGVGHPMLSKSNLETKCIHILNKYNVKYETQKRFDDCRDKLPLPFDFYFELNNKKYCIETDGRQHYFEVPQWGGLDTLLYTQYHDSIKDKYCHDNNITLIRISYKQINDMEKIIKGILEQ